MALRLKKCLIPECLPLAALLFAVFFIGIPFLAFWMTRSENDSSCHVIPSTDCPNRTFCTKSIVRNFLLSTSSAGSMVLDSNQPKCLCNETEKTNFQEEVKKIMEHSAYEYMDQAKVHDVIIGRFRQIKLLMKSSGLIAAGDAEINDFYDLPETAFPNETKVVSKNLNCTLAFVEGLPSYQSIPSNVSRTLFSPFLESGNKLTVYIHEANNMTAVLPGKKFNITSDISGRVTFQRTQPFFLRLRDDRIRNKINDILEKTKRAVVLSVPETIPINQSGREIGLPRTQPLFLRSNHNRIRRKTNGTLQRTKREVPKLDIGSIKRILKRGLDDFEELMKNEGYSDVVLGEIEFSEQLKNNPKHVEGLSTGPYEISLKMEWNDSHTYHLSTPSLGDPKLVIPPETSCTNRSFCIIEPIVRNFLVSNSGAASMVLQSNESLCLCNETEKADFQRKVKEIMGNSSHEYNNDTTLYDVIAGRFMKIKSLMRSHKLIAVAENDLKESDERRFPSETKVLSKIPNCTLAYVKGIARYQPTASNVSRTSASPFLEGGNDLTVCMKDTNWTPIVDEIIFNTTSTERGRIILQPKQSFIDICAGDQIILTKELNGILENAKNAIVGVLDSLSTSVNKILESALLEFEKLMRSREYFDVVLGKIKFIEEMVSTTKKVEAYSTGPFKMSLKIEWEVISISSPSEKKLPPQSVLVNSPTESLNRDTPSSCLNRSFCIIESIAHNFVIPPLDAATMQLKCSVQNKPLCLCDEIEKENFVLGVKRILRDSSHEYNSEENLYKVMVERLNQTISFMKLHGLIADAENDFEEVPQRVKVLKKTTVRSKNPNCTLTHVKGVSLYQETPSNVTRTSAPYYMEKGNNLIVCTSTTSLSKSKETSFRKTVVSGRIVLNLDITVCAPGKEFTGTNVPHEVARILERTKEDAIKMLAEPVLNTKSLETILESVCHELESLVISQGYFIDIGAIKFRHQSVKSPKYVEAYSVGPFEMSLIIEWS